MQKKSAMAQEYTDQNTCQESLMKKTPCCPQKDGRRLAFLSFLFFPLFSFFFFKDLLQIVLGFTAVKPERQVWSVTRELPQQAVELGLRFRRLEAVLVLRLPLWLSIFLYFGGTVFCVPAKPKLKFPMTLICFTKSSL